MVEMFDEFYMTGGNVEGGRYKSCACKNQVNEYSNNVESGNFHNCACRNQVDDYNDNAMQVSPAGYECNSCVLQNIGYAQAYTPYQETTRIMPQEKSLACGTIFVELVDPYVKGSSLRRCM